MGRSDCGRITSATYWFPDRVTTTLERACQYLHPMTLKTITLYGKYLEHYDAAAKCVAKYAQVIIATIFASIMILKYPVCKLLFCTLKKSCCLGRWILKAVAA